MQEFISYIPSSQILKSKSAFSQFLCFKSVLCLGMTLAAETAWVFAQSNLCCSIPNSSNPQIVLCTDSAWRHAVTSLTKRIFRSIVKYITWPPFQFRQTLQSLLYESMFLCLNSILLEIKLVAVLSLKLFLKNITILSPHKFVFK